MIKVQLVLVDEIGEGEHKITNLIGINQQMMIHADPTGQLFFAQTERVRVIGDDFDRSNPQEIFKLLDRKDVNVYFINALIFHSPDWNYTMVNRMIEEIMEND